MRKSIIFGVAAGLAATAQVQGAQVFTPAPTGELASLALSSAGTGAGWAGNVLYVRDGTAKPRVAFRISKDVSELDIADIAKKTSEFVSVEVMQLDALGDPFIGEDLGKLTLTTPPASTRRTDLMAIAWLFGIGLIGFATVGRRKKT
ncbi:MAG: hypothetical protein PVG38_00325 [Gammaproteobacteria bacterium]|jgi:hypothetical protein